MGLLLLMGDSGFNVRTELFSAGEQGLWLDPSQMSTMYQDSSGVTPCTAAGDPVGLILDQSRGGLSALGSELVTNGDFASGQTGWIDSPVAPSGWSFTGGALVGSNAAGGYEQAIQVTSGKWYRCTITLSGVSAGAVSFAIAGAGVGPVFNSNGTNTVLINVVSTGNIGIVRRTANFTGSIDNISVREVPGNHAFQTTSASRPTLQTTDGLWYLSFDGSDDSLVTNAVDFSATDEMTVIAGVRKLSDAADGMVCELSANATANIGSFYFYAPESSASLNYSTASRGTASLVPATRAGISTGTGNAPDTCVLASTHDISDDLTTLRRNGVAATNATGDKGSGNFGNYALNIGRRGGSSVSFNGRIYQLIVRGRTTATPTLARAERFVGTKTGVTF